MIYLLLWRVLCVFLIGEYNSPEKKVKQMNESIKDLKRDKYKKERIEHEYRKENPFTSVESMNAAVFQKLMESHKGQKSSRTTSEDVRPNFVLI